MRTSTRAAESGSSSPTSGSGHTWARSSLRTRSIPSGLPHYPAYYVPSSDIRAELVPTGEFDHSPSRGDADVYDVKVARATAPGAARRYPASPIDEIRNAIRLEWSAMDEWFEEDQPIYVHPRDPYTRVDILASSRHVKVVVDGETVPDSHQPTILFETGFPPRFYLPLTDLGLDLLTPSKTETHCPYKGTATYWHLDVNGHHYDNFVWIYRTPLPASQKIAGLAAFYIGADNSVGVVSSCPRHLEAIRGQVLTVR